MQYTANLRLDLMKVDQEVLEEVVMTLFQKEDLYPVCRQDRHHPLHMYHAVKVLQKGLVPNHYHCLGCTLLPLDALSLKLVHQQNQDLTEVPSL